MSPLSLLLVLCAAAPEGAPLPVPPEGTLVYEGPVIPGSDPSAYTFTTYAPGDKPFLAVDEANLRGSASIDAPVVRTLRLGSQVEVLEARSGAAFVKDRVDRWYRVRTSGAEPQEGFVLGNVLTPLAVTGDLDGDGKEESMAVSFTADFVVRVRVLEPELASKRKKAVAALDFLLPETSSSGRGGRARLVKVSAEHLGAAPSPRAFGLELCADDCVVHAVTYAAAKGALGELSVPPDVRGDVRLYTRPRRLFSLRLESEARGPEEDVPCQVLAQVRRGRFKPSDVLSCVITQPGKNEPDSRVAVYYLMGPGKQLSRLAVKEDAYGGEDLIPQLRRRGYTLLEDARGELPGLVAPEVLYADARGEIRLKRRTREAHDRSVTEVAFVHPQLGTVTMTRQGATEGLEKWNPLTTNGFFVPVPDGGFYLYAYQRKLSPEEVSWKDSEHEGVTYTLEHNMGCEPEQSVDPAPADVRAADLEEVGAVNDAGPLLALKRSDHPEVARAWEEWKATPRYEKDKERFASQEGFFTSTPLLYWRDSFGRLLRLRRVDQKPPCMAEPIVYFYPERRSRVRYALSPTVRVARAVPLARGNAWTFTATPQGILEEVEGAPGRARRTFAHLFWEGTSLRFAPPVEGVCVPREGSRAFFRELLPRLGLLPHETEDFVTAWAPRLEGAPFHVIGFHPREAVDALAPVEVSPTPASFLRILMDATPVKACPTELTPPSPPDALPPRAGFTVVEWGGVLRPAP